MAIQIRRIPQVNTKLSVFTDSISSTGSFQQNLLRTVKQKNIDVGNRGDGQRTNSDEKR